MKLLIAVSLLVVCILGASDARALESAESLIGSYRRMMIGGTWTLSLQHSGMYTLTSRGSLASKADLIEGGTWTLESRHIVLRPSSSTPRGPHEEHRRLHLQRYADGSLALVSASNADYTFLRLDETRPNKAPEPTLTSVMPPAAQESRRP